MAEEAGTQTTEVSTETTDTVVDTVDTTVDTQEVETVETVTETVEGQEGSPEVAPLSIDDIDWAGLELNDEAKADAFNKYSGWFKGKDEINSYLKELAVANQTNKEAQAQKVRDLEAGWEKSLKTDAVFGKDYEGNKKKVVDTLRKYSSESEMAELEKFGFTKSPVLNKVMLKIANEFADAKVVGVGQPASTTTAERPVNRFGEAMFDFTKKQ